MKPVPSIPAASTIGSNFVNYYRQAKSLGDPVNSGSCNGGDTDLPKISVDSLEKIRDLIRAKNLEEEKERVTALHQS